MNHAKPRLKIAAKVRMFFSNSLMKKEGTTFDLMIPQGVQKSLKKLLPNIKNMQKVRAIPLIFNHTIIIDCFE